jgi:hypothetical protein
MKFIGGNIMFTVQPATQEVVFKAFAGVADLYSKVETTYTEKFHSEYKQFALEVMRAATKEEKKPLNLSQTVRHLLVFDVAGDGKCQLRALDVSKRPILPTQRTERFCQLNTNQLFGIETTDKGQQFVTLDQENLSIQKRIDFVRAQYVPGQQYFDAVVTALVSEMSDVSATSIGNLRDTIRSLQERIKKDPKTLQELEKRIKEIESEIAKKEIDDAYLYEKNDPRWFCKHEKKLNEGLEKILGNECGNFWFSLLNQVENCPIITFEQKKDSKENHFIEFQQYLNPKEGQSDLQLACLLKVSGHWKAVMPLNDAQFCDLREKGLLQQETQVFHAQDDQPNKWFLEGKLSGKTFQAAPSPVVLTDELKTLCDKAKKGETKEIEAHLREKLKDDYIRSSLIQVEGAWILSVTTRGEGEVCLSPLSPIAKSAPVQQPAARPAAAGGGGAIAAAAKPSAARGGAASVAQPSAQLKVDDPTLLEILRTQEKNPQALKEYLEQNVNHSEVYIVDAIHNGWQIEIFKNGTSAVYKVINPPVASMPKGQESAARPAATGGGAAKPPVQQPAARPAAAGGGAAKPPVQQPAARPAAAGGGAAIPQTLSPAAKSLDKLDVTDSNLVRILQQDSNHVALDAYLKQFQKYQTYLIKEIKNGWVLTVVTNTNLETRFTINYSAKPAGESNGSCVVM